MVKSDLEPLVGFGVELVVCAEELGEPSSESTSVDGPTLVAESLRTQSLLGSHHLGRSTILVRPADLHAAPERQLPAPNPPPSLLPST